jgi:TPR repeat protein
MLKRILAGLVVAVLMAGDGAVAGPLEDATAADQRDDYATALKLLTTLAEQGNVLAQVRLGLMYREGRHVFPDPRRDPRLPADPGVPQDPNEAMKWFRLAAAQGNALAEVFVGMAYEYGTEDLPEDVVLAYMWISLAAAQGARNAAELRDLFALGMKPDQIAEAQRLAREWKPKTQP